MSWRIAESLEQLRRQLNAAFPNRSKASDGGIGDAAHASRSSDHNPWIKDSRGVGVVTARDFTHDPKGGLDCNWLAKQLVRTRDPRIKYIIWNRQICSSKQQPWKWRPYTGANAHTHHLHISVNSDAKLYDSKAEWDLDIAKTVPNPFADLKEKEINLEIPQQVSTAGGVGARSGDKATANPNQTKLPNNVGSSAELSAASSGQPSNQSIETKVSVEDGNVKVETSENKEPPKKIAIEKPERKGFIQTIRAEISALIAGNGGVQAGIDKAQQAQTLGLSAGFWKTLGAIVLLGSLIYLLYRWIDFRQDAKRDLEITNNLIAANSTPDNQVYLVDKEHINFLDEKEFEVIRR